MFAEANLADLERVQSRRVEVFDCRQANQFGVVVIAGVVIVEQLAGDDVWLAMFGVRRFAEAEIGLLFEQVPNENFGRLDQVADFDCFLDYRLGTALVAI